MYKLNHVQTTLRNELSEEIQDDKVHPGNARLVNDSLKKEREQDIKKKIKKRNREYFTINAINYECNLFEVQAEKIDNKLGNFSSKGVFIDKKK